MKRCLYLAALLLVSATVAAAQQANLLRNPCFEDGLTGWAATGTAQHITVANWHARSPKWSFGIGNDSGPDEAEGCLTQEVALPAPLPGAKLYAFKVWTMAEENYSGQLTLKLEFLDAQGHPVREQVRDFPAKRKGKWTERAVSAVAPAGTQFIRVSCTSTAMPRGSSLSFLWFDDASLTQEQP